MLSKIKALLLDFDNTLVDYQFNEKNAIYELLRMFNLPKNQIKAAYIKYQEINHKYWSLYEQHEITPDEIRYKRFEELANIFQLTAEPRELSETYLELFKQHAIPFPGVLNALRKLRKEGMKLFVLTNGFHDVQSTRITKTGIQPLIDGFLSSEVVGKAKPDPLMFKMALEQLGLQKNEVIMIGDNYASDIVGALKFGIQAVYITASQVTNDLVSFQSFTEFVDHIIPNNF